jgi:hypothetical protein
MQNNRLDSVGILVGMAMHMESGAISLQTWMVVGSVVFMLALLPHCWRTASTFIVLTALHKSLALPTHMSMVFCEKIEFIGVLSVPLQL